MRLPCFKYQGKLIKIMKKITIISILIIAVGLKVEAQTGQTYTQMFDSLFSNVSYSAVSSGILHDRVANFSDIDLFHQQMTDTSSCSHFIQAYSELHRAVTNPAINQKFLLEKDNLVFQYKYCTFVKINCLTLK